MDFERVLRVLAEFFHADDTAWGVVGGLAMAAHGSPRTTLDVDIVVDAGVQDGLIEYLESLGYTTLHRSTGYSNHLHADPELGRVDVVYVRGDTSRTILESVEHRPGPGGIVLPVVRAEHLVAMKVYAIKNDPSRTLHELADIRMLLDMSGVDRSEVHSYFARYGLEELSARLDDD